ncbi:MAG: hypothetical protein ABI921_13210 [Panacibacter sp.]
MQSVKKLEAAGTEAVKMLRIQKLRDGIPFMINSKDIPGNQFYLEYPDGNIQLVSFSPGNMGFTIIKKLTKREENIIRKKYNLF